MQFKQTKVLEYIKKLLRKCTQQLIRIVIAEVCDATTAEEHYKRSLQKNHAETLTGDVIW